MMRRNRVRRIPIYPPPPRDVKVHLADGSEVPVECVYVGRRDGEHHWQATAPIGGRPVSLSIGLLPAHTSVELLFAGEPQP